MELNEVQLIAVNISKVLKTILNDRISSSKIYDLVDEPNHHSFKIGFTAYNFFCVVFQYNLDMIDCYIEAGNNICIPLIADKNCYSDTVIEDYISKIKDELELRGCLKNSDVWKNAQKLLYVRRESAGRLSPDKDFRRHRQ